MKDLLLTLYVIRNAIVNEYFSKNFQTLFYEKAMKTTSDTPARLICYECQSNCNNNAYRLKNYIYLSTYICCSLYTEWQCRLGKSRCFSCLL